MNIGMGIPVGIKIPWKWEQCIAPGPARRYAPPPMAVRLAADLRPSADGSAFRTSPAAGQLQAASVPRAYSWGRQTDGSRYRLMPLPLRRGIIRQLKLWNRNWKGYELTGWEWREWECKNPFSVMFIMNTAIGRYTRVHK